MTIVTTTDEKLDSQTSLLKWILGGVGIGICALAVFISTYINNSIAYRDKGEDYLRSEIKKELMDNGATQKEIVTVLQTLSKSSEAQVKILIEMRDDQKKFPAVASAKPE